MYNRIWNKLHKTFSFILVLCLESKKIIIDFFCMLIVFEPCIIIKNIIRAKVVLKNVFTMYENQLYVGYSQWNLCSN